MRQDSDIVPAGYIIPVRGPATKRFQVPNPVRLHFTPVPKANKISGALDWGHPEQQEFI